MMNHMRNPFFGFLFVGVLLTAVVARAFADAAQDEAIKKDRKLIEGTWRVVALEVDGNKFCSDRPIAKCQPTLGMRVAGATRLRSSVAPATEILNLTLICRSTTTGLITTTYTVWRT